MTDGDARERLLSDIWNRIRALTEDNVANYPAAARAVEGGASPTDVVRAMSAASYELAFEVLSLVSEEATAFEAHGSDTFLGLQEDLLMADPTGREGSDLFE